jgi:hypothetical protein
MATEMMVSGSAGGGSAGLRKRLADGETVEVAGYEITPELAREMDALRLAAVSVADVPIDWFEVVPSGGDALPPGSKRIVEQWRNEGRMVRTHVIDGDPFWATVEVTDCLSLLDMTTRTMNEQWLQTATNRP